MGNLDRGLPLELSTLAGGQEDPRLTNPPDGFGRGSFAYRLHLT
jgi:hypothetical protein